MLPRKSEYAVVVTDCYRQNLGVRPVRTKPVRFNIYRMLLIEKSTKPTLNSIKPLPSVLLQALNPFIVIFRVFYIRVGKARSGIGKYTLKVALERTQIRGTFFLLIFYM